MNPSPSNSRPPSGEELGPSRSVPPQIADLFPPGESLPQRVWELERQRLELELQNRALLEAQADLQQSVQSYATLYDRLPVGHVTVTPQGRIIEANARAIAWLRSSRPHVAGAFLRSFLDAPDAARLNAHLQAGGQHDTEETLELHLRYPDRPPLAVRVSSHGTQSPAGVRQIHLALMDISALKRAQRELEDAHGELDAFTHSISHDLRAPLVTISTFGAVILEDHAEGLDAEAQVMVQRMRNAALRMEETLKQLLEYSRVTRQPMAAESVDLDELMRGLLVEHRGLIHYRKAEIVVERPLPSVRASASVVCQVLRNLLTNALKYTLPEHPPRVRIAASVHQGRVVLKVEDQGIGIDARFHDHVFKVFERLHSHNRYPGAGIGLAIVRRAMERLDGRVWLESVPGKGSTFFVELPAA